MTNCTEENNVRASSKTPTEVPQGSSFDNLASMKLEISDIDRMRLLRRIRIPGPGNNLIRNEFDADSSSSRDEKEGTSVFNPIDLNGDSGDSPPFIMCPGCDLDIEVSSLLGCSENLTYNSSTMICPRCDENLGEEATRMVQSSSFPFLQKGISNPQENGVRKFDWALYDKQHASWENKILNPTSDSHLSPSRDNVNVPSCNEFFSDEDTISDASDVPDEIDIPIGKSSGGAEVPDTSHEEDVQERSNKADFAQELFMSALFSE